MTEEHHFEFEMITTRGRMSADFRGNLDHLVGAIAGFRAAWGDAADIMAHGVFVMIKVDGESITGDTIGAMIDVLERKLLLVRDTAVAVWGKRGGEA